MKYVISLVILVAGLNVALLVANLSLGSALERLSARRVDESLVALDDAASEFEAERSHLSSERARLTESIERLRAVWSNAELQPASYDESEEGQPLDLDAIWSEMAANSVAERPDPQAIELLSPEELSELSEYRQAVGRAASDGVLIAGDVDSVLADPSWNPDGLELDAESRVEIGKLLAEYRYFARLSVMERGELTGEDVARRREVGAYVEYESGTLPAHIPDRLAFSYAEPSDREGFRRMYFFEADDHPDLYHHAQVENQQALRVFVDVHRLIHERGTQPGE